MAGVRFQKSAMEAIQEVAEAFICHMFEEVQLCCTHAKRVTIFKKDMDLWKTLVKPFPRSLALYSSHRSSHQLNERQL